MDQKLDDALSTLGICIKDLTGKVLYQNQPCLRACGDQTSTVCTKGCMSQYSPSENLPALSEGAHLFQSKPIDSSELFDMIIINDRLHLTTLLYPVTEKQKDQLRFLEGCGLSRREMEVMSLAIRGESNANISRSLFISQATLKTHLNNIYKKLPNDCSLDIKKRLKRDSS